MVFCRWRFALGGVGLPWHRSLFLLPCIRWVQSSHAKVYLVFAPNSTTAAAAGGAAGGGGNAAGGAAGGEAAGGGGGVEASGMSRREFTKLKSLLVLMQKASTHSALVNLGQVSF